MLITRPQPGADETAARIAARGLVPVVAPLLEIAPRRVAGFGQPQAILVTSGNALAGLPTSLHGTRLLAVGDATAARARLAGFAQVHSAGRDAAALAELAAGLCVPWGGPLLLASGAGQGSALAAALRARGFRVVRRVAYAARPVPALPEAARTALAADSLRAIVFFSPLTARVFVTMLERDSPHAAVREVEALAISRAAASALRVLPWRRVRVASHPTQEELLTLLP